MVTNNELVVNCRYSLLTDGYLRSSVVMELLKLAEELVEDFTYSEHLEEEANSKDAEIALLKQELSKIKDI